MPFMEKTTHILISEIILKLNFLMWINGQRIFKRSGAKYVVLTSKHHDGYCLFPNKESSDSYGMPWNSVDSGPKKRFSRRTY